MSDVQDLFQRQKREWIEECQAAARKLLVIRDEITIEDVLAINPRPSYIHRNTTGRVFNHDDFVACGFTQSRRPISKGRWIMKWKLNEAAFPMTMRQIRRGRQPEMVE